MSVSPASTIALNPARKSLRTARRSFPITAALCAASGLVLYFHHSGGVGGIAVLCLILAGISLISSVFAIAAYKGQVALCDEILGGHHLVAHWTCTPDEAKRALANQAARRQQQSRAAILPALAVFIPVIVLVLWFNADYFHRLGLGYFLAIAAAIVLVPLLLFALARPIAARRNAIRTSVPWPVYIGATGAIVGSRFISWTQFGKSLHSVTYSPGDPGAIEFTWLDPTLNNGSGGYQSTYVPVPESRDADARYVAEIFNTKLHGQGETR